MLDCRVYNIALAEYLGLTSMTDDEWAALAKLRGVPGETWKRTLFTHLPEPEPPLPRPAPEPAKPRPDYYARLAALNGDD